MDKNKKCADLTGDQGLSGCRLGIGVGRRISGTGHSIQIDHLSYARNAYRINHRET